MNKYQEALDVFNEVIARVNHYDGYTLVKDDLEPLVVGIKNLQELVDKATPKKPIKKTYEHESMNEEILIKSYYVCGCEKFSEVHRVDRFCSKCGQALDWSKDD